MKGSFSILKFGMRSVVPSHRLLDRHSVPEKIPFLRFFPSAQRCWAASRGPCGVFDLDEQRTLGRTIRHAYCVHRQPLVAR